MEKFIKRHIGPSFEDTRIMLDTIGVGSIGQLINEVIPEEIRIKDIPGLDKEGLSEQEVFEKISRIAAMNRPLRTFIGMGYYPTATPAVIVRNILENPSWYTSYTPYQAEISQGRLEALLNFQTMVTSLTGMDISNCSLLDEATAAAEAMSMMFALRPRKSIRDGKNVLFVDSNIFPHTLDVLLTRSEPLGIEIILDRFEEYEFSGREFGAILQYPSADGEVKDYSAFATKAHESGVLVSCITDLLSLCLLKPPADWGADIAVGSVQRFGLPMAYGGPHAAFLAAKNEFKRNIPGRIIGISVDRLGNSALRMCLQTREQHIKREKATSNICTSQALMAIMAGMYAVYHGPDGLKNIALKIQLQTSVINESVKKLGYEVITKNFFDTLRIKAEPDKIRSIAEKKNINFHYPSDGTVQISLDELTTTADTENIISIFAEASGKSAALSAVPDSPSLDDSLLRRSKFLTQKVFCSYKNETELMRYITKLEKRDISLTDSMIPLGSCTMKLNSAVSMMTITLPGFANIHPFVPSEQAEGYKILISELSKDLAAITGFHSTSLQPNSGAAGEYAGLMIIRAYHLDKGQGHRNIVLIPQSAHGTNPASAAMAGMEIITVNCDNKGSINTEDLKVKAHQHAPNLGCLMLTYPSTHGIFESNVKEIIELIHNCGGLVYMDGANMNAQVGLTSPGYIGADVCHLNLHKTFAMPHGGGGPGVGPICVQRELAAYLPSHPIVETGGIKGITAVSASPYGSAGLLPITYAYIKLMGAEGLRCASEYAILNANYMAVKLSSDFKILYTGKNGRVGHELIIDFGEYKKKYGVETADLARRLMDYGLHAPTVSFPVHETLMVEPTESESKEEIDRFIEALNTIRKECEEIITGASDPKDNVIINAPHTSFEVCEIWNHSYSRSKAAYPLEWIKENKFWPYVSRIDAGYGDRNLICNKPE
ncbi:MAG: aminomethyl-transferring glycine dehydrogenase [Rikenellaceae bacterium]|nr:aminomethyl-transferring glycine dehydrogenase [Rikenellaceae bacterium]